MITTKLRGIIPAVITPLDSDERFITGAYESLLEHVYSGGVHGIYVGGQTGEGLLQNVEQRKRITEASVRCSPGNKSVIVHVGAHTTAEAVELARHASRLKVTAISALPAPGRYTFCEIRAYYEAIAKVSDVPVLVYYFPDAAPAIQTFDQILELCAIPNVVGLKFTDFDLYRLRLLKQRGAVILNGRDEVLAAGLLMGADGGIGTFYNVVPSLFVELYQASQRNDWTTAVELQDRINRLIEITLRFPLFPAVKQMLTWMGIDCGPCIRPRASLTPAQCGQLRETLDRTSIELTQAVQRA
jgi:N-acetylneuraminate lyase